jgi:pimeloyl-ACP methyl ester carboxylesterase
VDDGSTPDSLPDVPHLTVDGHSLDYVRIDGAAPTIVFLHEGLGSIELWRDFPARLCARTGRRGLVFSRYGYGDSDVLAAPRAVDYMHHEALVVLAELLDRLVITGPVLVGHSDGASIALIAAGSGTVDACALVLLAPHVFVEGETVAGIEAARVAWETTDLPTRLARRHRDAEATFWGWNDIWLDPAFRSWNIEDFLPGVHCPVLCVQGAGDRYGTAAQLDAIEAGVSGPVERVVLDDCGHSPHLEQPEATLDAVAGAISRACRPGP